ncbi:MAG: cyclic nucleotide-binding domain-containing protein [Candidatus Dormibacteria bacterium]|jgi:CRP-like cAMP-binding protein
MNTIADLIAKEEFFAGLDQSTLEFVAGCGRNVRFAAGDRILTEGEPADTFYLLRSGSVAITFYVPGQGGVIVDTIGAQDVLGWSWLFDPYRWQFDAEAREDVSAVAFDGVCLRTKCDGDPQLGYSLILRFARVMLKRLQSVRMRVLDIYGSGPLN